MKKATITITTLLVLFFSLSANAQHRVGVVGGLNVTKLEVATPGPETEISSRTVFGLGGVIDLRLHKNISLLMQPMYLQKGALVADLNDNIEFPFKFAFFELPVLLKAEFGSSIRPYLMAGPTVGYLLSAKVKGKVASITFEGDMKEVTERIDFGLSFGAGLNYPLRTGTIFLQGSYELGLTNMQKGGPFEISAGPVSETIVWDKNEDEYKNRGFQIMAGSMFPLGGQ